MELVKSCYSFIIQDLIHTSSVNQLERIKKQEERCPNFPFERKPAAWVPRKIKGRILMPIAWVILFLFDILLLLQSIIGKPF